MSMAATGENFRPSAICCDISAKNLVALRNLIVQTAEQSSHVPLPVTGIWSMENANHDGRRIHNHSYKPLFFSRYYGHQRLGKMGAGTTVVIGIGMAPRGSGYISGRLQSRKATGRIQAFFFTPAR